ncbi:MAG: hypothetical protein HY543_10905 [Deltaproteobacteria bacterium]|nr:hypothetical protein [Deltaproteobacteria bacterium]
MARGDDQRRGPIEGIGRGGGRSEVEATRQPAAREPAQQRPDQAAPKGDQFRRAGLLEGFIRKITERIEHGWLYQTFRLPGSQRVIHDRRGEGSAEARSAAETPARPLSRFEARLVERFEQGVDLAQPAPDGKTHFLAKTAAQWKAFFARFLQRAEKKQVPIEAVAQAFTMRALLKKTSDPAKGVVVSDFQLADGTKEKFARFDVHLAALLSSAAQLEPGASVPKEVVARGLPGQELSYIAIGKARGEQEGVMAPRDAQGVFTNLKTEAQIAERLGFPTPLRGEGGMESGRSADVESGRAPRGLGKWFRDAEEPPDDAASQAGRFVPWWHWAREERLGLRRWFVPVTLIVLVILLAIGAWSLITSN